MMNAPTPDEVSELLEEAETDFGALHTAFAEDEKYYELDFKGKLGLPKEHEALGVVLPTARGHVDTFADYIDIANARVQVARRDESNKERESAETLQKFGMGLVFMSNVQGIVSPWRVLAKHYPLYGLAVAKTVFSADRWPDKPEKKARESIEAYQARLEKFTNEREGAMPILIEAVNPQTIYFDTATMGETWVIQTFDKKVSDVLRKFSKWQNKDGKEPNDKVTYVDYWDRDYRCVLIDDQPVLNVKSGVAEHGYGFVPFTLIDAGLGNVDGENDLVARFVGINRYLHDVLISQSRDYSIVDVIVAKNAWPVGVITGPDAKTIQAKDIQLGFGTYLPLGDIKLEELTPKMAPQDVTQHFGISGEIMDGFAIPRSLRGQSESGVRSGADRRQILAAAQYRLRYSEMAFKHRTSEILNKCARIGKNVISKYGNVRVFAYTPADEFEQEIDFKKVREPISFNVEFAPVSEEDEYRRHDDLERLLQSGIATRTWARRQISTMNEKDLHAQELKEQCRASPAYQEALNNYMQFKMQEAMATRIGAEQPLGPVTGPPGGGPPSPGGAPPQGGMIAPVRQVPPLGGAQALQQQMQGMRSQTPMNPMQGRGPNAGGAKGPNR